MFGKINTQFNPMENISIKANTVLGLFKLTLDHSVSAGKLAIYKQQQNILLTVPRRYFFCGSFMGFFLS